MEITSSEVKWRGSDLTKSVEGKVVISTLFDSLKRSNVEIASRSFGREQAVHLVRAAEVEVPLILNKSLYSGFVNTSGERMTSIPTEILPLLFVKAPRLVI